MCSVQDEGDIDPKTRSKISDQMCMKCTEKAVVVIRGSDPMCKACFLGYCTHKFRASFGKSRVVRDGEVALVAYSAGHGSAAMLHLIQQGKSPRANRKLRFQPSLVYIDEGGVLGLTEDERQQHTRKVVDLMVNSTLPWCVYRLEQALDPAFCGNDQVAGREVGSDVTNSGVAPVNVISDVVAMSDLGGQMEALKISDHLKDKLTQLLATARTATAKENIIQTLRTQLLVSVARHRGFLKLFLGDTCTRLAVRMISDISQGRGAHVALQMSFADSRHGDVTIVRPMREFVAKETAMYLRLNSVETIITETITTMQGPVSIDRLTEDFVAGLQAVHPRTVPTVFRTGEKMDITLDESGMDSARCAFCLAPLDTDTTDSSALRATLFSQSLSNKKSPLASCGETTECCGEGDGSCHSTTSSVSAGELNHALCYGCRLVIKDMGDFSALPEAVLDAAGRNARRCQMKESIQEFLLPEEPE